MATSGAVIARIISQYSDKGSKAAQKDIAKMGKQIDAWSKKVVKSYAVAGAALAAFGYKVGKESVQAAIEDSKSATILANTLKNVTNATDAQVKSVEDYISKQQMLVNITDTELRSSLNTLVSATKSITQAQYLQNVAVDAAVGGNKDLATVSMALAKASQGNLSALGKLYPAIDKGTIKAGDFGKALTYLETTYKGAAEATAKQDPFTQLKLQFDEIKESLGYALLPVIKEYATYLITTVIPKTQEWIKLNEDKLKESFKGVLSIINSIVINLVKLTAFFEKYKILILTIAAIPVVNILGTQAIMLGNLIRLFTRLLGAIKLAPIIASFRGLGAAISLVGGAFRAGGILAALRGAISLFAQLNPYVRGATILIGGLTLAWGVWKKITGGKEAEKKLQQTKEQAKAAEEAAKAAKIAAAEQAKADAAAKAALAEQAKAKAKAAADAAKTAAKEAAIKKGQDALAKMGVKTTEADPIQLEAARLNLVKQGNLAEAARVAAMSKNLELQLEANKALARYNDLLAVLADKEVTSNEVFLLSKKWGMTVEATQSYIQTLIAVADQTISDEEITNLAKAWGVSKEQASRYLDFFTALNDGKLSDAEINKLQTKWGLTSKEVGIYQDLITKASDYVLSDAEINDLKKNWGLTTDEVVAYIKKLGQPVTFSGTLIDPATQATLGWKSALAALEAYQKALAGGGYKSSGTTTTTPSTTTPSTTVVPTVPNVGNIDAVTATVKAQTETFLDEIKNNQTLTKTASEIANEMAASLLADEAAKEALGGTAGVLSSARYTGQALQYYAQQEAAAQQAAALQRLKEAEAAAKATKIAQLSGEFDSPTIDNAGYIASNAAYGSPNITINVAGSVTTEGDLIANIRNGLLNTQYNGNSLLLSAAAI